MAPAVRRDRSAFKLAAGGKFNSNWGLEIGYVDLGDVSPPAFKARTRAQAANLSLVASTTVFDRAGINAKVGGVYGWTRSQLTITTNTCLLRPNPTCDLSQSDRGFGVSYGAGLSARVAPHVELCLDWDRYRLPFGEIGFFERVGGEHDVDMWSVGLNILF